MKSQTHSPHTVRCILVYRYPDLLLLLAWTGTAVAKAPLTRVPQCMTFLLLGSPYCGAAAPLGRG